METSYVVLTFESATKTSNETSSAVLSLGAIFLLGTICCKMIFGVFLSGVKGEQLIINSDLNQLKNKEYSEFERSELNG